MSKKQIDPDAYDVSPAVKKATLKLLTNLIKDLEAGCKSIDKRATLSDEAIGTYRRRYRLSLQRVLSDPATASFDHRRMLGPAIKCHGQLAASIAAFHRTGPGPLSIDRDSFLKAAHVIEIECKAYALRASAKRLQKASHEVTEIELSNAIFCW
jgi:hypothetical protein